MTAIEKSTHGWFSADFTPGSYVAVSFLPDSANAPAGAPLDMVQHFTVTR